MNEGQCAGPSHLIACDIIAQGLDDCAVQMFGRAISLWMKQGYIFNLTPVRRCNAHQKWEINSLSWLLTSSRGRPFSQYQLRKKIAATSSADVSVWQGDTDEQARRAPQNTTRIFATFSKNGTKYEAMSYQARKFDFTITITRNLPLFIYLCPPNPPRPSLLWQLL